MDSCIIAGIEYSEALKSLSDEVLLTEIHAILAANHLLTEEECNKLQLIGYEFERREELEST